RRATAAGMELEMRSNFAAAARWIFHPARARMFGMLPPYESVSLPDFDDPEGEAPNVAKRFAFYGDLARFASSTGSGRHRQTPVQCRRRPGRRQCRGLLVVRRQDLPAAIEWECPSCSAAGCISGWEGTPADLRGIDLGPATGTRIVAVSVPTHAALREIART